MRHHARHPGEGRTSRVLGRPSSRLGWASAVAMAASIGLVILLNITAEQGSQEDSGRRGGLFVASLLCVAASGVLGLVAVVRRHERSWIVLLPTALISLAIINELIQGVVVLMGGGSE